MNFKDNRVSISVTLSVDNLNFIADYHKKTGEKSLSETLNKILTAARDCPTLLELLEEVFYA